MVVGSYCPHCSKATEELPINIDVARHGWAVSDDVTSFGWLVNDDVANVSDDVTSYD